MNTPVVFQALPKWDSDYASTSATVAKLLSEDRLVFYVEHPFSLLDRFRTDVCERVKMRLKEDTTVPFDDFPNFIVIHPNLIPPINKLPEGVIYNLVKQRYLRDLWIKIDKQLEKFGVSEFQYVNSFDPTLSEIKSRFKCTGRVYHSVDWIGGESYIAKHGLEAEKRTTINSDLVITTSHPLAENLKKWNTNTHCVPNAADFKHFSTPMDAPDEYKNIKGLKAVYVGNIGLRLDYELIENLAKNAPHIQFIFVGPIDSRYFEGEALKKLSNVHFLGAKSYDKLPAYIQHADVCLIPFKKNELTRNIYPLKINEYLATGKPVISSEFTDLSDFDGLVFTYEGTTKALEQLNKSVYNDSSFRRIARTSFAAQNTWTQRLTLWKLHLQLLDAKAQATG